MAEDVIVLLDYLGWTGDHDLHVVGSSLGGMIAQGTLHRVIVTYCHNRSSFTTELAARIPDRIVSLTLTVTTAGGVFRPLCNLPPVSSPYDLFCAFFICIL
jgi:pimeloyl-ACP methyl ester carboxylesterase